MSDPELDELGLFDPLGLADALDDAVSDAVSDCVVAPEPDGVDEDDED